MDAMRDTFVIVGCCLMAAVTYCVGMIGLFCTVLVTVAMATSPIWVPGAVSFDTSPGQRVTALPGRSDQIRHFSDRDHAGRLGLEGKSAPHDVPLLGFDFGSVFSRSAPMGAAPFDRSSPWVGRGGVTFLTGLFKRCFMPRH